MKRMKLSEDEIAVIEGMRHERAIWNGALEAALARIVIPEGNGDVVSYLKNLQQDILALRKAD